MTVPRSTVAIALVALMIGGGGAVLCARGALELISDSGPRILRTQLLLNPSLPLTWGDRKEDDGTWRVRIVRDDAHGCCGGCACD